MSKNKLIKISLIVASCLILTIVGYVLDYAYTVHVFDVDNNEIGQIIMRDENIEYICDEEVYTYVDVAWNEAIDVVMGNQNCSENEAVSYLIHGGALIYTDFDAQVNGILYQTFLNNKDRIMDDFAVSICDTKGNIIACCSYSVDDNEKNYVIYPTYAASAIKPLSVYAPAMDEGIINWSTLVNDSPVTKIKTKAGEEDWPRNINYYTYEDITVAEAVKKSYNTIAVKVLKMYGVDKSCNYINQNYGIDVSTEKQLLEMNGEDEILGNIALGYLRHGVTVKDMSGYYQVFANGGRYTKAHTIERIVVKGEEAYTENIETEQVISRETAYICNRMLKLVVSEGGTAESVDAGDADLCGKTGTSDDFKDNWLVGFTPEYVCATWYSSTRVNYVQDEYFLQEFFSEIMKGLEHDDTVVYDVPETIVEKLICKKTGLCATEGCEEVFQGYYIKNTLIKECDCE